MTKPSPKNSPANLVKRVLKARKTMTKAEKEREKALRLLIKPFVKNCLFVTVQEIAEWLKKRGGVDKLVRNRKDGYTQLAWECLNATRKLL